MNGSDLKEHLKNEITYANATPTVVKVAAETGSYAQIVPPIDDYSYKKGDPITLRFTPSDSYVFKYCKAEPAGLIEFDDKDELSTVARLTDYADCAVTITPVSAKRPEIEAFSPQNAPAGVERNKEIKIDFDHALSEDNDLSRIVIKIKGDSVLRNFADTKMGK